MKFLFNECSLSLSLLFFLGLRDSFWSDKAVQLKVEKKKVRQVYALQMTESRKQYMDGQSDMVESVSGWDFMKTEASGPNNILPY